MVFLQTQCLRNHNSEKLKAKCCRPHKEAWPYYDSDVIKVITGVRRCGKSVLLESIRDELIEDGVPGDNIIYINLEDLDFDYIVDAGDLNTEIKKLSGESLLSPVFFCVRKERRKMRLEFKLNSICIMEIPESVNLNYMIMYSKNDGIIMLKGGRIVERRIYDEHDQYQREDRFA